MFQGCLHRCSHRAPCLEGPRLGFMLCCHHLEILNNFLTEGSWIFFFFSTGPHKLCSWSCMLSWHSQPPPASFYRVFSFHFSLCATYSIHRDLYNMLFPFSHYLPLPTFPPSLCGQFLLKDSMQMSPPI